MEEHFGIVPLEAMSVGTPVIAVDSGESQKKQLKMKKRVFYVPQVRRYFLYSIS